MNPLDFIEDSGFRAFILLRNTTFLGRLRACVCEESHFRFLFALLWEQRFLRQLPHSRLTTSTFSLFCQQQRSGDSCGSHRTLDPSPAALMGDGSGSVVTAFATPEATADLDYSDTRPGVSGCHFLLCLLPVALTTRLVVRPILRPSAIDLLRGDEEAPDFTSLWCPSCPFPVVGTVDYKSHTFITHPPLSSGS